MKLPLVMAFCALCALPVAAQDNRFVTFKTVRDNWGKTEHQIDRTTIRQEGPYRTFWTRLWLPQSKQPLALGADQQLYIVSQKFAVDCERHRFAGSFIDSTDPKERKKKADLRAIPWTGLDKNPTLDRAICGNR